MQDEDGGRQSGLYALGGTLAAAGGTLFSIGLTVSPRSQTLQFLGLIVFVVGLVIIIYAMAGRRTSRPETVKNKTSAFSRLQVVTVAVSLVVIAIGGFAIFGLEGSLANQGTTGAVVITDTSAYAGPSAVGYIAVSHISTNTQVRVICTVYGSPFSSEIENALWDYTDHGWLNDHFVSTGTQEPTAPGCTGTTKYPSPGTDLPTKASGPYAVIADEGRSVPVQRQPALAASTIRRLPAGTFVRLQCTIAKGPVISAPRAIGPSGSNNVWDRIVEPDGWIPDSYVATYSLKPVTPSC
jgi:hypothetical protein